MLARCGFLFERGRVRILRVARFVVIGGDFGDVIRCPSCGRVVRVPVRAARSSAADDPKLVQAKLRANDTIQTARRIMPHSFASTNRYPHQTGRSYRPSSRSSADCAQSLLRNLPRICRSGTFRSGESRDTGKLFRPAHYVVGCAVRTVGQTDPAVLDHELRNLQVFKPRVGRDRLGQQIQVAIGRENFAEDRP